MLLLWHKFLSTLQQTLKIRYIYAQAVESTTKYEPKERSNTRAGIMFSSAPFFSQIYQNIWAAKAYPQYFLHYKTGVLFLLFFLIKTQRSYNSIFPLNRGTWNKVLFWGNTRSLVLWIDTLFWEVRLRAVLRYLRCHTLWIMRLRA